MSFSMLVREHETISSERADRWEQVFLELQVVLAYCDGELAPAERMTLSLLSLAKKDERENRVHVDRLIQGIERHGLDEAANKVVDDIEALLQAESAEIRTEIARELLHESIAIVVADDVISEKERTFVTKRLAPGLGMSSKEAEELLRTASGKLTRERAYIERAFECYLLIVEVEDGPPTLNGSGDEDLPGFLGTVDKLVVDKRLGSSRVAAYFLTAMGGIFWVDDYQEHVTMLGRITDAARELRTTAGADGRLRAIQHELSQLRNRGVDSNAFHAVSRHLTNALGKMNGVSEAQREVFRDKIAPALEIDHTTLLETSGRRRSMIDLHRNLTGQGRPAPDETDPSQKWWRFWK